MSQPTVVDNSSYEERVREEGSKSEEAAAAITIKNRSVRASRGGLPLLSSYTGYIGRCTKQSVLFLKKAAATGPSTGSL
jgi:hypothetical protein